MLILDLLIIPPANADLIYKLFLGSIFKIRHSTFNERKHKNGFLFLHHFLRSIYFIKHLIKYLGKAQVALQLK